MSVCENFSSATRIKDFHRKSIVGPAVFFLKARGCAQAAPLIFWFVGFCCCCENQTLGCESHQHVLASCFVCIFRTANPFFDLKRALEPRDPARFRRTFQIEKRFSRSRDTAVRRYPRSGPLKGPRFPAENRFVPVMSVTFLGFTFRKCVFF